ncbi:group II intron reverse transcriptase/maturase [Alkalicella caledoniensis]|uniref:Group II intron reverse transcriptase/maturase n=1 Tax=Alkalicella caledoniensis TaxID=2731377 RepID=A0A7G9W3V2_ALKCA|nr:group II intron reverse transcriptase/maturase [Alkalicella caledoniensis]QNO13364.1 group II intron reverse transcriptase/maturase [Alkalicella caledoniensis]
MMLQKGETPLNTFLRHAEYYGMQETFDNLHEESKLSKKFYNLYDLIISEENILLAYRSIKSNSGAKTAGIDNTVIGDLKELTPKQLVSLIQTKLGNYKPKAVRRIFIPKENGDQRPLGIPTIIDRLIQQMIKQIIEPIAEAKFYKHSYGFRPLRNTHHAIARAQTLINIGRLHYVIDIDIKGFFDNVNHNSLIKQIWNLGIRDKRVIAIISKILKTPIQGEGRANKGVPQGGVLSPLLSNIVLHDLDQWVYSQWEGMKTKWPYKRQGDKIKRLKNTNLKEGYLVRYADDFKVFARNSQTAYKWFYAIKKYLKDRLKLDISPEKSKVTNLRKKKSDFLGYRLKANLKGSKYVAHTYMKKKKKTAIKQGLKEAIKKIKQSPTRENAMKLNSMIMGLHQYFKYMTHVFKEFSDISFSLSKAMYNGFKRYGRYEHPKSISCAFKKYYNTTYRTWRIAGVYIFPIADISTQTSLNFSPSLNIFTEEGRKTIHKRLQQQITLELPKLMESANLTYRTTEYIDNRISRYSMTMGKCEITCIYLPAEMVHCHHYVPTKLGGTDKYHNLRIVHKDVHKLIHATEIKIIKKYMESLKLDIGTLDKINRYREKCNLEALS